jgi:GntR family transcriptional regulator/MocR family aminotransferase
MEVVPVPVDDDGLVAERLAAADVALCVLTPAHHFPTGAVMSAERRAALVRWARERDSLILEDDYDAEYRYDREPIGAIQGLAPECVLYAGSASKTLAPGLRLGWLILPARFVEAFATAKFNYDRGTPSLEQLAFADFLARGEFDRHLRRMRPIYRSRRDALLGALARHLPAARPTGASAGLHVLAWLPDGADEAAIVDRAAALDVAVDGLSPMRVAGDGPPALILGYARLTEREIEEGVERLASAVPGASGG